MKVFNKSDQYLKDALDIIPLGSQTFSKSYYSLPQGAAPLFIEKGDGAIVTDVDGNEYIDLVSGLLCVSLGYNDEDVNQAIVDQLKNGISFSLPHRLETEVAKKLIKLIPCAQMVRFGKNGTDVTSAAIRLARAYTGKSHVAICGYHGWQDWYIATTSRDLGVPQEVKNLSHVFQYNNLSSLENIFEHNSDIAAVIMEPMGAVFPDSGFLQGVRDICDKHDAILIFDEVITGFRFHINGAQTLFNVIPDLATFGKGMANGMPISALVGKKNIMKHMDDIFFSGTFGGETLSLAAANATINKMLKYNVVKHFDHVGGYLNKGINNVIKSLNVNWLSLIGHNSWNVLSIDAGEKTTLYKSLLLQELIQNGVLTIGSHNISYAFDFDLADKVVSAYECSLGVIQNAIEKGEEYSLLKGQLIKPVFKVR